MVKKLTIRENQIFVAKCTGVKKNKATDNYHWEFKPIRNDGNDSNAELPPTIWVYGAEQDSQEYGSEQVVEIRFIEACSPTINTTNDNTNDNTEYIGVYEDQDGERDKDKTYVTIFKLPEFKPICEKLEQNDCKGVKKRVVQTALLGLYMKQITVFHGPSGTGKSYFAEKLADALGAEFTMCEVQSNWTDKSDLLGYYIPRGEDSYYVSTPFLEALIEAKDDPKKWHIICLDEMNLARVEYYFATFLSATQRDKAEIQVLPPSVEKEAEEGSPLFRYKSFKLPPNVRFIGTMNNDDTTNALSPKVIDRCVFVDFGGLGDSDKSIEGCSEDELARMGKGFVKENFLGKLQGELGESHRFMNFCSQAEAIQEKLGTCDDDLADLICLSKVLPTIRELRRSEGDGDQQKKNVKKQMGILDEYNFSNRKIENMFASEARQISYF